MSCSSGEWSNYTHQTSNDQTSTITTHANPLTYIPNSTNNPSLVTNPNGSKSTKRKSRASKKAPTTILKTEVNDFRALVQQLTGRPTGATIVGTFKGPLNISFGEEDNDISSKMVPFDHNQDGYVTKEPQNHQQYYMRHEDIGASRTSSSVAPNSSHTSGVVFDDFDVDDVCFEELAWLPSSNGTTSY